MTRREMIREYLRVLNLHDHKLDRNFLNEITRRHIATFAFSNVGCQLGEDLPLDFEALFERIVVKRRGGYCFEQNGLLYDVLDELGFSVKLYLARVINNQDIHPGLTHRVTIVEFEGQKFMLDVGFGLNGPRAPVSMSGRETSVCGDIFRIAEPRIGEFHMQVLKDGGFFSLYRFELVRYGQADCEVGHFYSHKHPKASFVNHLVVSLILDQETRSLRDLVYWVMSKSKTVEQSVDDPVQLRQILIGDLGVQVSEVESHLLYERLRDY